MDRHCDHVPFNLKKQCELESSARTPLGSTLLGPVYTDQTNLTSRRWQANIASECFQETSQNRWPIFILFACTFFMKVLIYLVFQIEPFIEKKSACKKKVGNT